MKLIIYLLLILTLVSCGQKQIKEDQTPKKDIPVLASAPKIVFVLTSNDIDLDTTSIDNIINEFIKSDSIFTIKSTSNEIYLKPQVIKAYRLENISCGYLKRKFKDLDPSTIIYEYNDKLLVKAKDGVIKIYHYHLD